MEIMSKWNEQEFFDKYWCKKPCIIKGFFGKDLIDELDINEMSSLAMEENIVSRIINLDSNDLKNIKLTHGPFSEKELTSLPEKKPWSLLIQDIDKMVENFDVVLENLSQIPTIFFDDIMASIGNKNSGTGPHLDWYNVFILQTHGQKLWKVETNKRTYQEHDQDLIENLEIKILKNFRESTQHLLSPMETLYIPPGHGHHGIASSDLSMSFSIGYQGPRLITLIETYLSRILKNIHEDERVNFDPNSLNKLNLQKWPAEIKCDDKNLLLDLIELAREQDY